MMGPSQLAWRSLTCFWRANVAVVLGVATAVAVLAGALVVGDTVRGSLRDLVLQRLGRTDLALSATTFFREALADDLRSDSAFAASFADVVPLIVMRGVVTEAESGRRASGVAVYGVDERFWRFHGVEPRGPTGRTALASAALASEIGIETGKAVLVRVERPSAVPIESLHGQKDSLGRTLRLTVSATLDARGMGDFSLVAHQGDVLAVFVPLTRLQQDLDLAGRVNTLIVGERAALDRASSPDQRGGDRRLALERALRAHATLEDVGLSIRVVGGGATLAVESAAGLFDRPTAQAVDAAVADVGGTPQPVFTYLANAMRVGTRQVPYSLVTAIDFAALPALPALPAPPALPALVLNDWAARDLAAKPGDTVTLEYYVWEDPGRLVTRTADFTLTGIVPIAGAAADRDLAPHYPGITEATSLGDWDPPFPIDLSRVRHVDEDYWQKFRTTPKAFVPLDVGQRLWRSRYGDRTSTRLAVASTVAPEQAKDQVSARLRQRLDPTSAGMIVRDVRAEGLSASRGATDFGAYFTYFSFFLVVSALLLASLFFRLGVEQRVNEVGLLRAVGFTPSAVRRVFVLEALVLTGIGAVVGLAGAVAYGQVMTIGLRTWWSGAVGTRALTLHIEPSSLIAGAAAVLAAALGSIWWTLGRLTHSSVRSLLTGSLLDPMSARDMSGARRSLAITGLVCAALGVALLAIAATGRLDRVGAFFGAGASWLTACVCVMAYRLRSPVRRPFAGHGWWAAVRLGARSIVDRPGRSVLAVAVIASAVFILVAVDAFRRAGEVPADPAAARRSGTGGYPLLVDLQLPLVHDPDSRDGQEALGLTPDDRTTIQPFRVLPGDDASCLNLYEPTSPRVLGVPQRLIESGRFAFQGSLAESKAERANPWLLLNRDFGDATPVVADANSMTYVLHKSIGDDIVIERGSRTIRLRLVAALADSIFQRELLMSEQQFLRLFPEEEGYRFLLAEVQGDAAKTAHVATAIEKTASDLGADAVPTAERLAEFHRVENTYISTFQALGGLGLLVGTLGLGAVVLRNVLERRRELALLGAVGFAPAHILIMVLSENLVLLGWGLAVGAASALVAIAPSFLDREAGGPITSSAVVLVVAVFIAGLLSSIIATRTALRGRLLEALRAE